ncbi:MAG: serine hydrolase domain-containing protein [Alphaproteobacteria bacterium]
MARLVSIAIALAVLIFGASAAVHFSPIGQSQLPTGSGIAAKQTCSLVFVSNLDPDTAWDLYVAPLLGPAGQVASMTINEAEPSVTVSIGGFYPAKAVHRPRLGCTLHLEPGTALEPTPADLSAAADNGDPAPMPLDRAHRAEAFDTAALDRALDEAFATPEEAAPRNTLAALVLHDGRLVAERYAPGITGQTPLPGWSMTKSITATLAGVLVDQGRLDVDAPGAIARWRNVDDPRSAITLDHLLRMTSGLKLTERNDGFDENSRMLFTTPDAAAFASAQPLVYTSGSHYEYMSGSTVLAMDRVQEVVGGGLAGAFAFIQDALFHPLGMDTAVMEPDQEGTFIGSSFMLAGARDWARFGQLYLDGGVVDGQRLISTEWIAHVTRHTAVSGDTGYGAGFWLTDDRAADQDRLPEGTFYAWGFQGQYIFIMPNERLVVVRLGATNSGNPGAVDFAGAVAAALK